MSLSSIIPVELEQIPTAIALTDLQGVVQGANRCYRELAGSGVDLDSTPQLDVWLVDSSGLMTALTEQLASGKVIAQAIAWTVDGAQLRVQARYRSARDTQQLLLSLGFPTRAPALAGSLASRLIHDIRSPLNAILGFSRLLQEDSQLPANARESAETIGDSAEKLHRRIDDCADILRTLVERETPAESRFRLSDIVQEALRSAADRVRVRMVDEGGCQQTIVADEMRLRKVMSRMLRCAEPQPEAPAQLSCSVNTNSTGELQLELRLWPCGPGTATAEDESDQPGDRHAAAMDLAICRQLVRFLGGRTRVEQARLQVVVPVHATSAAEDVPEPAALPPRAALESGLRNRLAAAAQRGDLDALRAMLPEVEAHDAALAGQLAGLIEAYDYPGIDRLLAANKK